LPPKGKFVEIRDTGLIGKAIQLGHFLYIGALGVGIHFSDDETDDGRYLVGMPFLWEEGPRKDRGVAEAVRGDFCRMTFHLGARCTIT